MKNKLYVQNIINLIVFIICIAIIFFGSGILIHVNSVKSNLPSVVEDEWREQARRTLSSVYEKFIYDSHNDIVDPSDDVSLQQWAKRNINGLLNGGETGTTFMINLGNEKIISDSNTDIASVPSLSQQRYMKDEIALHYNKQQTEFILDKMRLGTSTNSYDKYSWDNLNGVTEYLEWIVIPSGSIGFNDEPKTINGVKNPNYSKILIAIRTEKSEIEFGYAKIYDSLDYLDTHIEIFIILSIIICFINMLVYVYLHKKI